MAADRAVSSRRSRSAIVRSSIAWWERAAARRCSAARTSPLGAPSPVARATTVEWAARAKRSGWGAGWAASVAPSRSAAAVDPVTSSTDCPRLTASAATAAAVVVLPAPGAPVATVIGSRRERATTACWAVDSVKGVSIGSWPGVTPTAWPRP